MNDNPILPYYKGHSFVSGESVSFGRGDINLLRKINNSLCGDKRDNILLETLCKATHWDWVKQKHIQTIFALCDVIYDNIDKFIPRFKKAMMNDMETMEKEVEAGKMAEGDYLSEMADMKKDYDFITDNQFVVWLKTRSEFINSVMVFESRTKVIITTVLNPTDGVKDEMCLLLTSD